MEKRMKKKATHKTQKSPRTLNALEVYLKSCANNKTITLDYEAMEDSAYDTVDELISPELKKHNPELKKYYEAMLERIIDLQTANLPADWDGVFRATSK